MDGELSKCSGDGYPSDGTVVRFCAVGKLPTVGARAADRELSIVYCGPDCETTRAPVNASLQTIEYRDSNSAVTTRVGWSLLLITVLWCVLSGLEATLVI